MHPKGRYPRKCPEVTSTASITPVTVFSLNLAAWNKDGLDPSSGADLSVNGFARITAENMTVPKQISTFLLFFVFTRGGSGTDFDSKLLYGTAGPLSVTSTGSPHTHVIQYTGNGVDTFKISGVVDFDVHY